MLLKDLCKPAQALHTLPDTKTWHIKQHTGTMLYCQQLANWRHEGVPTPGACGLDTPHKGMMQCEEAQLNHVWDENAPAAALDKLAPDGIE